MGKKYLGDRFPDSPASLADTGPSPSSFSIFTNVFTEHCIVLQVRNICDQSASLNNFVLTQEINLESEMLETLETALALNAL